MLDGWPSCGFCGQVLQASGKERNVPIQSLGGCPGHNSGALEMLERVAAKGTLQAVASPSALSEPEMGPGSHEEEGGGFTVCA